jgi:ethanolamine ammonia-lyase small subunit
MKVRILTVLHGIFDVEVEQQEKVATLKTKISQQKGYSVSQIRLIYNGRVLKDDEIIQQLNLKDTSFVIILMKVHSHKTL